jgi:hypothetical protein
MNIPNSVLYLAPTSFTSTGKFASRVESLVLVICVLFQCFVNIAILVICLALVW